MIWAALPNGSFYPGAHPIRKHFLVARDSHSSRRFHHLSCATPVKASVRLYPSSNIRNSWPGRIITFAEIVGQENVIAGTDCGLGGRVHPQIAWAKLRTLRDRCGAREQEAVRGGGRWGHVFTEC
jgi:hypothetical protein